MLLQMVRGKRVSPCHTNASLGGIFHIKNKYYTAITKHFARYVSDGQIVASCMHPNEDLIPRLIQSTRNFFPDLVQPANLNII